MSADVWVLCALIALFVVGSGVAYVLGFLAGRESEQDLQHDRERMMHAVRKVDQ